jgi:glycosyltransferase involved in cell wall biosynthesis
VTVAYIASRYPKASETFVFREVAELERQGLPVLVIAFMAGDGAKTHPDAASAARLAVLPTTRELLASQLYWLRRSPANYARVWRDCIAGTVRSPRMLLHTLAAVPLGALVARLVSDRGISHIHAHRATHPATCALVAGTLSETPFSFTAHGYDVQLDTTMLATKLRRASFGTTVSQHNHALLTALDTGAYVEVVRCGIDLDAFGSVAPPSRHGPFRITCVGRLSPEKGQEHLLRALALLQARSRHVTCSIVGDGIDRARLERLCDSLGLAGVDFHGQVGSAGVRQVLASSHAMVLPSLREGLPVAVAEAMAMGVPVIASDVGGVPEIVRDGDTGLLVGPCDDVQIAHAIERLIDDPPLARRLADNASALVRREYAARVSAARLATLYAGSAAR